MPRGEVGGTRGGRLLRGSSRLSVESRPSRCAVLLLLLFALLAGCATPRAPSPPPEPERARVPAPPPRPLAVLLSDDVAMYQEVAHALGARAVRVQVHSLKGDEREADAAAARLERTAADGVVAIGSLATRAVARLAGQRVVYCLDFTAEAQREPRPDMHGVRAWPPALVQLQAWKQLDPRLARVALLSGEGGHPLVEEALAAAEQLGIELEHIQVSSDRELLYVVKRLRPEVQGIWFPPDNRVVSAAAMREALAHSLRQGKQTLVFSSQLLQFGALLSVEADPRDVADRVLEQLRAGSDAPALLPLRSARTSVNPRIARQLGLDVPAALRGGSHVF